MVLELKVPHETNLAGGVLWANLHLLFWLSLFPFVTGWMGENSFQEVPVAAYGCVLLLAAIVAADGDVRDRLRQVMVGVFTDLGQDHPLAAKYRRELASALY